MPHTDLPLEELRRYAPDLPAPDDLAEFWADTLAEAADVPLDVSSRPVGSGLVERATGPRALRLRNSLARSLP